MSKAELRAVKGSPPRQEKRYGSISYGSPNPGGETLFGADLESVGSDDRRHSTVDEALAILHASEPLPSGTPGGSQEQLRRGALVDGASVRSGGECQDTVFNSRPLKRQVCGSSRVTSSAVTRTTE